MLCAKKKMISWFIGLSVFRVPISALVFDESSAFRQLLALSPLLYLILDNILSIKTFSRDLNSFFGYLFIFGLMQILFLYFGFTIYDIGELKIFFHTSIVFSITPFLLQRSFKEKDLREILVKTSKCLLVLGSLFLTIEVFLIKFSFFTPREVRMFLISDVGPSVIRVNSFLFPSAIAASGLLVSWLYLFSNAVFKKTRFTIDLMALLLVSFLAIFSSDSLYIVLVLMGMVVVTLIKGELNEGFKRKYIVVIGMVGVYFFFSIFYLGVGDKLASYFLRGHFNLMDYLPHLNECSVKKILINLGKRGIDSCQEGEVKFLEPVMIFGVLPVFSYYFSGSLVIFSFIYNRIISSELVGAVTFLLLGLHYGGADVAGYNYFFLIFVTLLTVESFSLRALE